MNPVQALDNTRQWRARLELAYEHRGERTVVAHRRHLGPLVIQKPFYPEGGVCHNYLLHPPGGIAPGDSLELDVHCRPGSQVLLTTPASGKFYRSDGRQGLLRQHFRVDRDATLEWLPQENIIFRGSHSCVVSEFDLQPGARLMAMELTCLGRPACDETFDDGMFRQDLLIRRDGLPLFRDSLRVSGDGELRSAPWGLGERPVSGTLVASLAPDMELPPQLDQGLPADTFTLTRIRDLLICRCLDHDTGRARNTLQTLWHRLRPLVCGRTGSLPRIWNT